VTADLTGVTPSGQMGEGDSIAGIEAASGGSGDDRLLGNVGFNELFGLEGDDRLASGGDPGSADALTCGSDDGGWGGDFAEIDADDLTDGCESTQLWRPPPSVAGGEIGGPGDGGGAPGKPAIAGRTAGGTVRVGRSGVVSLARHKVSCAGAGPSCAATAKVSTRMLTAKTRRLVIARKRFKVTAGASVPVSVRLTKKGRQLLKRRHRMRVALNIDVTRGTAKASRTIRLVLVTRRARPAAAVRARRYEHLARRR